MNYKKILKSRNLRIRILAMLNWIPDRVMIPIQYRLKTGRWPNLKTPERFTEKMQYYKLHYRNPLMLKCTDKYEVRQVVEEMGLANILIPLIGVYNNAQEIDFNKLPNEFVAKTTDGGGGNQVFICRDKSKINKVEFYNTLNGWMKMPKTKKTAGREWAYENDYPRRIVIEKLIKNGDCNDLPDYKFFCFNGKPQYCQYIDNRSTTETIDFYDMEWRHQDFVGLNSLDTVYHNSETIIPKPENFDRLKSIAEKLAGDYPFVRVDLYNTANEILFGELTFYPASGFGNFTPDEWDYKIGELLDNEQFAIKNEGGGKMLINCRLDTINKKQDLSDYKFFCFNGTVGFVYGISDRRYGESARIGIYDREFNKLNAHRADERPQEEALPKPANYDTMISVAETLSKDFPEVRVDLYNVDGKIYFGELTFYDGSGYMSFDPDSFDFEAGKMFDITSF